MPLQSIIFFVKLQPSGRDAVVELDDAGAELAVAGTGYGAGRPEVGGGDQGTPAKEGARSCWHHAGQTGGALFVGAVAAGECTWLGSPQSRR